MIRTTVEATTSSNNDTAAPDDSSLPAPLPAELQRILELAVTEGGIPGVLAQYRDGGQVFVGSAGVADIETGRPRSFTERFRIGSTTKTFVATVLLRLEAEGVLDLGDTVEQWLPGVVRGNGNDGSRIRLRQLLQQTSGIFNYTLDPEMLARGIGPGFLEHRYDDYAPEELIRIAMTHPPVFEPGTDWAYSNSNFVLAGMVVERATGRSLAEEIAARITGPLGMSDTYLPGSESTLRGPHARHYSRLMAEERTDEVHDLTELNPSAAWAAGGMVSTLTDLDRFFGALLGGRLLPPAQYADQRSMVGTEGSGWIPNTRYGLGLFRQELPGGGSAWGHGGAIQGSWSYTMGNADGTRMLSCSVNADWAEGRWTNPIDLFVELVDSCLGPDTGSGARSEDDRA